MKLVGAVIVISSMLAMIVIVLATTILLAMLLMIDIYNCSLAITIAITTASKIADCHTDRHNTLPLTSSGAVCITRMAALVIVIALTDITFAMDSISTVLTTTTNPTTLIASQALSILLLRCCTRSTDCLM